MQPLRIIQNEHNSLLVKLVDGEHLTVFPPFIATGEFRVKPVASLDMVISRLLAGRLMECHFAAHGGERTVQLHGGESHGKFLVLRVEEGEKMLIRFPAVAGYRLGSGGRFVSARKLFSPVRWFTGTTFAVVAVGPVDLVLYGADLVSTESQERLKCFAHRLVAFDACVPFRIRGLRPEGHLGSWFDALSSVVEVDFDKPTPLVRRTIGDGKHIGTRVRKAAWLIFGVFLCGSLIEHCLLSTWLWSWIL